MYSNILVGNKAAAENIVLLAELGVTHLLNCAGGERRGNLLTGSGKVRPLLSALENKGIQYKELSLKVSHETKNCRTFHHLLCEGQSRGEYPGGPGRDLGLDREGSKGNDPAQYLLSHQMVIRRMERFWSTVLWAPVGQPLSPWHSS